MLILSRNPEESTHIGDDVVVKVLDVKNGQVRFGLTAPREIAVHREEIYNKIAEQRLEANENLS